MGDRLAAPEDAIYAACKRWAVANDCATSANPVGPLWPYLRLPLLSAKLIAGEIATDKNDVLNEMEKIELLRWAAARVPLRRFVCLPRMVKEISDGMLRKCYQCKHLAFCYNRFEENPSEDDDYVFCRGCFRNWTNNAEWEPQPSYLVPRGCMMIGAEHESFDQPSGN